jgi:hypothetical protein
MDLRDLQQPPHTLDILRFLAAGGPRRAWTTSCPS